MARVLRPDGDTIQITETDLPELDQPDKDARYTLRVFTQEKYRELETANTTKVINKRTHQSEPKLDDRGFSDDLVDWAIADWSGIVDGTGAPLPCTREYKLRLDGFVRAAIIRRAGANEVAQTGEERKAESFRQPGSVS